MKIGSIVECTNSDWEDYWYDKLISTKTPMRGKTYTLRAIINNGVLLEELVNKKIPFELQFPYIGFAMYEDTFDIKHFRELLPPIANIEQHINKNVLEPELI